MTIATNLRSRKTGLPPGSPIYVGKSGAEETKINLIHYDSEHISYETNTKVDDCLVCKEKFNVLWIDVTGLRDTQIITSLCEGFNIHPLIIEDLLNTQQRPKVDVFENYIFLTVRSYINDSKANTVNSQQVSFILAENLVITFSESATNLFDPVKARLRAAQNIIRKKNSDYLIHALLDLIVDGYFGVVEVLGDKIEDLDERLTNNPNPSLVKEIHNLKREMIFLRKSIWPLREVVSGLQHRMVGFLFDNDAVFYLKDIYDHTVQIIDTIETYRDFLGGMLDIYLSSMSNKMNQVMKVLTIFASIFIPLTFLTSLYGMNFNTNISPFNMPELSWRFGYLFVWAIIILIIVGMLAFYKKKKWW